MALRYLLDTNICIYVRRRRPPEVLKHFEQSKPGDLAISLITWGELIYGAEKSLHRAVATAALAEFVSLVPVMPMGPEVAPIYGRIRAILATKGELIGGNDLWIAAHALALGVPLVTNNTAEFRRIPGLKLENWTR